jgi:hypothetical protein
VHPNLDRGLEIRNRLSFKDHAALILFSFCQRKLIDSLYFLRGRDHKRDEDRYLYKSRHIRVLMALPAQLLKPEPKTRSPARLAHKILTSASLPSVRDYDVRDYERSDPIGMMHMNPSHSSREAITR